MGQASPVPIREFPITYLPSSQLFGEDEDATGELDDAEKQGENGEVN